MAAALTVRPSALPPSRRSAVFALFLAFLSAIAGTLAAQGESAGGVEVTPDGGVSLPKNPNTGYSATFAVLNDGSFQYTFNLTCGRTGAVASCESSLEQITLAAGASGNVPVEYTTGSPGTGTVTLTASRVGASDQGSVNVTVMPEGKPGLLLKNHNRDNLDRSLCLTVGGAGEAAAVNCGQLLVTHSTPGYATMGRSRALTLLYNSGQAAPGAVVAATVTQRAYVQNPSSLYLEIKIGGVIQDSATYNTSGWGGTGNNQPRQAVLWFVDTTRATGVYPFVFMARNKYPGSSVKDSVLNDTLIVVNRTQSQYGAGWSLVGVERLYENQPAGTDDILWVGGDGSAKRYRKLDATHWRAAAGAFRDTLVLDSVYTRTLRHGIKVVYDSSYGRHIRTVTRTGQKTTFSYSGSSDRLTTIQVPPAGVSGTTYTLDYDANSKLFRITDPANRNLDVSVIANRLRTIIDPDAGVPTRFAYDSTGAYRALLKTRTTRRGFMALFAYQGNQITLASVPHDTLSAVYAITGSTHWNTKGWNTKSGVQTAVDTGQVYTKVSGPRIGVADDASFWVDRWGAPVRTVGAINDTTFVYRGSTLTPALITRLVSPDKRSDSLVHDGLANLTRHRITYPGDPTPRIVRWTYKDPETSFAPDSMVDSTTGLVTRFKYNHWGLDSLAFAPNGHISRFEYVTSGALLGLVKAVWDSLVPVHDSTIASGKTVLPRIHVGFAFNTLGNTIADTSATGRVRSLVRDGLERVTQTTDAGGHVVSYSYDAINRLRNQRVSRIGGSVDTTLYAWRLDALEQVTDPRGVYRKYRYDPQGRTIGESDDFNQLEQRWFSLGGALDSVRQRTGHFVRRAYDAAGRQTKLAWPARDTAAGMSIAGDSVLYSYDIMGRLLKAKTSRPVSDTIFRTYYPSGLLKTEVSQRGSALYSVGYGYDVAGRRIWLRIGTPGSATNSDSVWYRYGATGDLEALTVNWRGSLSPDQDSVKFAWDPLGRRDSLRYTNGLIVRYRFDAEGSVRLICGEGPGPDAGSTGEFDFVHHVNKVDADGQPVHINKSHPAGCPQGDRLPFINDTIGYDVRHFMVARAENSQIWNHDRSGNRELYDHAGLPTTVIQDFTVLGHNRLDSSGVFTSPKGYKQFQYDANGARIKTIPCNNAGCHPTNWDGIVTTYYDGMGRSVGQYTRVGGGFWTGAFCWYDALGRQINTCAVGDLTQLAYDGDNVVRTGWDGQSGSWTFIHGPGTDDPLLSRRGSATLTHFYVGDGQGRQFVVADRAGNAAQLGIVGAKAAGGITESTTFDAARHPSTELPKISFFRNRWYDQETNRWTQEDPIGIAGGVNLYQYAGNNPVVYTDPFGLCIPACLVPVSAGSGVSAAGLAAGTGLIGAAVVSGWDQGQKQIGAVLGAVGGFVALNAANSIKTIGRIVDGVTKLITAIKVAVTVTTANPPPVFEPEEPPQKQEQPEKTKPKKPDASGGEPPKDPQP